MYNRQVSSQQYRSNNNHLLLFRIRKEEKKEGKTTRIFRLILADHLMVLEFKLLLIFIGHSFRNNCKENNANFMLRMSCWIIIGVLTLIYVLIKATGAHRRY